MLTIIVLTRTTEFHSVGGFEDHIKLLYTGLSKKNHRIHVITTRHPDKETLQVNKDTITYYFLKNTTAGTYTKSWKKESIKKLFELLKCTKADIIHSQSYGAEGLSKAEKEGISIPIIASFHGTNYDEYKSFNNVMRYHYPYKILEQIDSYLKFLWLKTFKDKPFFNRCDTIIATSNEQKEIFKNIYNIAEQKIKTIYNGIPITNFYPKKTTPSVLESYKLKNGPTLLAVARFASDKGLEFIIQAMPEIITTIPNCNLLIIGDGSRRQRLEKHVKKYQLADSVLMPGFIKFEELPNYFNACDLVINYTIRQNGYDLTMVEAMACEKVVISSNIGSTPTLIQDNINGILIEKAKPSLLAKTVISILNNNNKKEKIEKEARKTIEKSFTAETMINATEKLFYDIAHEA